MKVTHNCLWSTVLVHRIIWIRARHQPTSENGPNEPNGRALTLLFGCCCWCSLAIFYCSYQFIWYSKERIDLFPFSVQTECGVHANKYEKHHILSNSLSFSHIPSKIYTYAFNTSKISWLMNKKNSAATRQRELLHLKKKRNPGDLKFDFFSAILFKFFKKIVNHCSIQCDVKFNCIPEYTSIHNKLISLWCGASIRIG